MFTLVLYISCQQLGDMCKLLGVCGPFTPGVGGCISISCCIWAKGMGVVCQLVFSFVLYISCQQLGDMCELLGVCGPFGPRVGMSVGQRLHCICVFV